jgi:hypothetical protein
VVLLELLLRKQPVFTTESGTKQNLSDYFFSEIKTRPITEIISAEVLEEATEEEINKIASLAEICLRLQGEERPAMKQVVISLQLLRTERMNSSTLEQDTEQLSGNGANVPQRSQNCSSLQREFLSSASLPR